MRLALILGGICVVVAVAILLTLRMLQMDSNLSTSVNLARELKTQVTTLRQENFDYREQLRGVGSRKEALEEEKTRLERQLAEAQRKQRELEKMLMGEAERVARLDEAAKSVESVEEELVKKDQQLRELTQELEVVRAVREASAGSEEAPAETDSPAQRKAPEEPVLIPVWNSASGVSETIDVRGMMPGELRWTLERSLSKLRDDEKKGGANCDRDLKAGMHYNLGVLLAQEGDYWHATENFRAALDLRPEDADCHYNLAVIYDEKVKDAAKALEHYREYLRLDPDTPELLKIQKWIIDKEAALMVKTAK